MKRQDERECFRRFWAGMGGHEIDEIACFDDLAPVKRRFGCSLAYDLDEKVGKVGWLA